MRIATMTASEPALRTAYLMVHDEMERGLIPVVAKRLGLSEGDLTVRLCAAAVTGAFRVIDEDVSRAVVVDENEVDSERGVVADRPRHPGSHQRPPRGTRWSPNRLSSNHITISPSGSHHPGGGQGHAFCLPHNTERTVMTLPELISVEDLFSSPVRAGAIDLAGRHHDRLPGAVEGPAQRVGAGRRRR